MNKQLKEGMSFDSLAELCDFLEWPSFDGTHPDRLIKKMNKYFLLHKEGKSRRVIDEVFCDYSEMKYPEKKKDGVFRYSVGEILDCRTGKVKIVATKMLETQRGKRAGYVCECLECGSRYEQYEYNLKNRVGCGVCDGKKHVREKNSFQILHPEAARLLENQEEAREFISLRSSKNFVCPICGNLCENVRVSNVVYRGLYCPCMRTRSVANRIMYWCLKNLDIAFMNEHFFEWSDLQTGRKIYDFYLPDLSCIVEMNGAQHYIEATGFTGKSLNEIQENDRLKESLAKTNGIEHYIIIDCTDQSFEKIKEGILNSKLSILLPLNRVDWQYVDEQTHMQLMKMVAEVWNKGIHDSYQIATSLGFKTREGAMKYIKKADESGLLHYDPKEAEVKRKVSLKDGNYQRLSKPLHCPELGLYFGNRTICAKEMTSHEHITFNGNSIYGTRCKYKGYTFCQITKEEFNKAKRLYPEKCSGDFFIIKESVEK